MTDITKCGAAARRTAHALVRLLGASCIHLQMPAPAASHEDGDELGLTSPVCQLWRLSPAAVRRGKQTVEVLLPADVVEAALGAHGACEVRKAMAPATGVKVGDEVLTLQNVEPVTAAGTECLYRLVLQQSATEVR